MSARWLIPIVLGCAATLAQAAEPTVRVKVEGAAGDDSAKPVVAGQSVRVTVTILAPNFFLSAPAFPSLQVPGAVVTMPDERGANSTETIDGASFAGITKTYVFTPQTAGDFALPTPEIPVRYSGDDGKPRDGSVTLPATTIHVGGQQAAPAQAAAGAPTLPAGRIQISERFDQPVSGKDAHLRAGDALVRTITIFAPGTPAMMIEPPALAAVRGVRQFRADPLLQDGVTASADDSAGATGGRRVESITYVFADSGRYTLPAVTVAWYDPATGKRAESVAAAVTVEIARAPSGIGLAPSGGAPLRLPDWLDWRVAGAGLVLAVLVAYGMHRWRQGAWAAWRGRRRKPVNPLDRHDGARLPPLNP